jgi:hypothetical protein
MGGSHFFKLVASPEYITCVPARVDDEAPHMNAVGLLYHMRLRIKVSLLTSNTWTTRTYRLYYRPHLLLKLLLQTVLLSVIDNGLRD